MTRTMTDSIWGKFYKKSFSQRHRLLMDRYPHLFESSQSSPINMASSSIASTNSSGSDSDSVIENEFPLASVDLKVLEKMIENCVGVVGLPLGLSFHLKMNGTDYVVPMAIEEPSVVAALSNSFKVLCHQPSQQQQSEAQIGMIAKCLFEKNLVDGQILIKCLDASQLSQTLTQQKGQILEEAISNCRESLIKRGCGPVKVFVKVLSSEQLSLNISVDVGESMGANTVNGMLEGLKPFVQQLIGPQARIIMCILSNYSPERITKAEFRVPIDSLDYNGYSGDFIAERIMDAFEWAKLDPQRAVTNNKGIMNGVDAVALACGQDWRAIEAAVHAFAVSDYKGQGHSYRCLTEYQKIEESGKKYLQGSLSLPLQIGVVGGAMNCNPVYKYCFGLLGNPTSKEFSQILCCVGLAQNFAALRSLVTEGIQRGHMSMHARSIAMSAGSLPDQVDQVAKHLISSNKIDVKSAAEYLNKLKEQNNNQFDLANR